MTIELAPGPAYRSYSSFTSWLSCGKAWQLSRVAKVTEVPAWYFAGGTAFHETTEWFDRELVGAGSVPDEWDVLTKWQEIFESTVRKQVDETGVPTEMWRAGGRATKAWPDKENGEFWRALGPEMVNAYAQWRIGNFPQVDLWFTPTGEPAIELELNAVFRDQPVKMFIDRVFTYRGDLIVTDLKTGAREPDSTTQLGFYAAGLQQVLGTNARLGAYYMGRTGTLTEPVQLGRYTPNLVGTWIKQFNTAVDAGVFLPNLTNRCKACGVARACAAVGGVDAAGFDPDHPDYNPKGVTP